MTRDIRNGAGGGSLSKLLDKVRKAPASERMHLRNEVAAHGAAALDNLQPWLGDDALASFAIRAIGQIGDTEANRSSVLERLRAVRPSVSANHQQDIDEVLARWGERAIPLRARGVSTARKVDLTGEAPLEWGLRAQLVAAAHDRHLVTYAEAGEPLELSMRNPSHRPYIGKLLGAISEHELLAGRPMLSSIVVKKGENSPGTGFFVLGDEHGLVHAGEDEKTYCARQIKATFDYWSSHEDPEAEMVGADAEADEAEDAEARAEAAGAEAAGAEAAGADAVEELVPVG